MLLFYKITLGFSIRSSYLLIKYIGIFYNQCYIGYEKKTPDCWVREMKTTFYGIIILSAERQMTMSCGQGRPKLVHNFCFLYQVGVIDS